MTYRALRERSERRLSRIHHRGRLYVCFIAALVATAGVVAVGPASASPDNTSTHHAASDVNAAGGTIAQLAGPYRPKGRPAVGPKAGVSAHVVPQLDGVNFRYAEAEQQVRADGARGYYTIAKPVVAATDYHSLAELAVSSSDSQQAVEIGWTVDRNLNGDSDPHLFVYHWVDGQPTCYNGCGFVPANVPGITAGMKLPVGTTPVQFSILHHGTEWVVGYNGHPVGSFPDALWTNRFKVTGWVQWFGEVAASTPTPCTDMGNGQFATSPTASRIQNVGFWPGSLVPNLQIHALNPNMYTAIKTDPAGFRYGGTGDCRTVPSLIGDRPSTAIDSITSSGLVVGTAGSVDDPLCEDIGIVLSQTPAAGTRVAAGSAVSYKIGVPPRSGCPINPF